jgi:excisionase family DNA binding protein
LIKRRMDKVILTTTEVAELLGISVRTAQLLVEGGSLRSWKTPGGHRRVYRADVLALKEKANENFPLSSALIFLYASPQRLPALEKSVSEIGGCTTRSFDDQHSLSVAIGSQMPAAVAVDLGEKIKERQALVRSLTENPDLNHMRIIVVGEKETAVKKRNDLGRVTHVAALSKLPATIRSVIGDPPHTITFPTSISFPFAANEGQRLVAVERSGLVDSAPEEMFDRITWLASQHLHMPVALFTLLTSDRQWFKSHRGVEMKQIPRDWAFCNHTILQRKVFAVNDLTRSSHFLNHPAVVGDPNFRFYAGAPVIDSAGFALGSLCVIDYRPREFGQDQTQTLLALAQFASNAVQLRSAKQQLRWALDELRREGNSAT